MPAPQASVSFSAGVAALERIEQARKERDDQMRNALEILADVEYSGGTPPHILARFVQRTARKGLGRE